MPLKAGGLYSASGLYIPIYRGLLRSVLRERLRKICEAELLDRILLKELLNRVLYIEGFGWFTNSFGNKNDWAVLIQAFPLHRARYRMQTSKWELLVTA